MHKWFYMNILDDLINFSTGAHVKTKWSPDVMRCLWFYDWPLCVGLRADDRMSYRGVGEFSPCEGGGRVAVIRQKSRGDIGA